MGGKCPTEDGFVYNELYLTNRKKEERMMENLHFLYDYQEETKVRFISFLGKTGRFDLALLITDQYFGKTIVMDIQKSRFAIMGQDDLEESGYLEDAFSLTSEEASELKEFLMPLL